MQVVMMVIYFEIYIELAKDIVAEALVYVKRWWQIVHI